MDLGGFAIAEALIRAGVTPDQVDYVLMGQVILAGQGQITARQAAVKGGIPLTVPANTINKVCLSGLHTIYLADQMIRAGDAEIVVAGGMESMTQAPYLLPGARAGFRIGDGVLVDSMMHDGLTDAFDHIAMGLSTEQYNEKARISRARQDAFAAASHEKAAAAAKDGRLAEEIVAVQVPQRKGDPLLVDVDEGVRPGTTAESLAALKPAFDKNGTITAGNASQISDGGAAVIVMSAAKAKSWVLRPWARSSATARSPAPTPRCSRSRRGRSSRRRKSTTSRSGTSTCSRSTRPSPPSGWPRWTTWASTRRRSTSTVAPSRSGTRSGCRAHGWRSPPCSSCAGAGRDWPRWRCAAAAGRATPPSCAPRLGVGAPSGAVGALEGSALVERWGEQVGEHRALPFDVGPAGDLQAVDPQGARREPPARDFSRSLSLGPSSPRANHWVVGLCPTTITDARSSSSRRKWRSTSSGSAP